MYTYIMPHIIYIDIKECINGTNEICEERCIELEGGFRCGCKDGYRLRSDNVSCEGTYVCNVHTLLRVGTISISYNTVERDLPGIRICTMPKGPQHPRTSAYILGKS